MPRLCTVCSEPIPQKRLEARPNATTCVPCLTNAGDVRRIKRYDEHDQYGNEIASVYFTEDPELEKYLKRMGKLRHQPTPDEILEDDSTWWNVEQARERGHCRDALRELPTVEKGSNHQEQNEGTDKPKSSPVLVIKSSEEAAHGTSASTRTQAA